MPGEGRIFEASEALLAAGALFLLVFPPLRFGAAAPEAEAVTIAVALGLGFLLAVQRLVLRDAFLARRRAASHLRGTWVLPALGALLVAWGLLLLVPLPEWLLGRLSPQALEHHRRAALAAGVEFGPRPLSLYPSAGPGAVAKLAAGLAFFAACLEGFRAWKLTRMVAGAYFAVCFAVSFLGIVQSLSGERILWAAAIAPGLEPFGPFVNRNHFAAWAGTGGMVGLGLLLSLGRSRRAGAAAGLGGRRALLGFMVAVVMASVFLSLSRGGMMSLGVGLTVAAALLASRSILGRSWRVALVLLAAILVMAWVGAGPVLERLGTMGGAGGSAGQRVEVARDLLAMIASFPLAGTGPGSFGEVYPFYQTAERSMHYTYAHNDWLQVAAEWGLPGLGLFVILGLAWARLFFRYWARRRDREALYLGAAAFAGATVAPAHSLVDFGLHVQAVALAFLFAAAFALKASGAVTARAPAA